MLSRRANLSGFSLIELVMVLMIVGILAAIAVPRYAAALGRYRAASAAQRVVAELALARSNARQASVACTVAFTPAQARLVITWQPPDAAVPLTRTTNLAASPYEVQMTSASFGGDASVTFDGYGVPDSGGTVVLTSGGVSRTIELNAHSGKAVSP